MLCSLLPALLAAAGESSRAVSDSKSSVASLRAVHCGCGANGVLDELRIIRYISQLSVNLSGLLCSPQDDLMGGGRCFVFVHLFPIGGVVEVVDGAVVASEQLLVVTAV